MDDVHADSELFADEDTGQVYIESMAPAAVAAGADGLEIEVHNDPPHAWSDGAQCLKPDKFAEVIAKCRKVAAAIGREM